MLSLPVLEKFTEATESRYERLKKFQALHSDEISLDELIMLEMHMTGIQIPEPLNTILKNHNHDMRPNAGDVNLRFLRSIKNCLGESLRAEIPTIVRDASPYLWDGTDVFIWEVHTRTWKPLYYYPELVIRGPVEQSYFYERTVTSHGQRILNLNENNGGCIVNCPLCPKSAIAKGYLPSSQINSAHNLREILTYQGLQDLSEIDEVAVVTNAFDGEKEALKYLKMLITQLHTLNFQGTLVWYGFNLRSERGIADLAQSCQKNGLSLRFIYTIETFSRPFNAGPKRITIGEVQEILKHAQQYSNQVLFSYIVGLDDLSTMEKYMNHFISFGTSPILSDFFLADWDKANKVLKGEARDLSYYVQARRIIRAAIEKYMPSEQKHFALYCESNASPFFFPALSNEILAYHSIPGGRVVEEHPILLAPEHETFMTKLLEQVKVEDWEQLAQTIGISSDHLNSKEALIKYCFPLVDRLPGYTVFDLGTLRVWRLATLITEELSLKDLLPDKVKTPGSATPSPIMLALAYEVLRMATELQPITSYLLATLIKQVIKAIDKRSAKKQVSDVESINLTNAKLNTVLQALLKRPSFELMILWWVKLADSLLDTTETPLHLSHTDIILIQDNIRKYAGRARIHTHNDFDFPPMFSLAKNLLGVLEQVNYLPQGYIGNILDQVTRSYQSPCPNRVYEFSHNAVPVDQFLQVDLVG